jgi:hypothetical protein
LFRELALKARFLQSSMADFKAPSPHVPIASQLNMSPKYLVFDETGFLARDGVIISQHFQ